MYLDDPNYRTVWQLAHEWAEQPESLTDSVSPEATLHLHRILVAVRNKLITARTFHSGILFASDSAIDTLLFELFHLIRIKAAIKRNKFNRTYLSTLYVWKPEVLDWCIQHRHTPPYIWADDPSDPDGSHWYFALTDRRKEIAGVLFIAAKIWEKNKQLDYQDVYNHPEMEKYNAKQHFTTIDSFKSWTRPIAPQKAKSAGKRRNSTS